MKIGLDFDNTIVNYDKVFYDVALEWHLIPKTLPINKLVIRNYLRDAKQEDLWTHMQGYVYGARMGEAAPYPGVMDFAEKMKYIGHTIVIVSHKTKHPFLGPKYNLHIAALEWIEKNFPNIDKENIFFEPTKDQKLERIEQLQCDIFIDDLPEILTAAKFPKSVFPILFDPDCMYGSIYSSEVRVLSSWFSIDQELRIL
jgi:5'(3')-deoxyribonucleotidase